MKLNLTLTPVQAKLLRERNASWVKCRILLIGISRALRDCCDAGDVEDVLELAPGLANTCREARAAAEKFTASRAASSAGPKPKPEPKPKPKPEPKPKPKPEPKPKPKPEPKPRHDR